MKQLLTIITLMFSMSMFAQTIKLDYNTIVVKSQSIHEDESSWYFGQSSIVIDDNSVEISLNNNEFQIKAKGIYDYWTSTDYVVVLNVTEINGESKDIHYEMSLDQHNLNVVLKVSDTTEFLLFNL